VSEERLLRRVGIYGGTFDPVHNGHLRVAEAILNAFALDQMVFVPAYTPPHKRKQAISSPFHRMSMLALATAEFPKMFVSTIELDAPSRPYTIETLARLRAELDPVRLFFVMGADSFKDLASWREYERILGEFDVIVATRPGYSENEAGGAGQFPPELEARILDLRGGRRPMNLESESTRTYLTDYVTVDVSATRIREAIEEGRPIDDMVPPSVAAYIGKYRLYQ
jgi:nicotinate-nucleotide adenylyltransferase